MWLQSKTGKHKKVWNEKKINKKQMRNTESY